MNGTRRRHCSDRPMDWGLHFTKLCDMTTDRWATQKIDLRAGGGGDRPRTHMLFLIGLLTTIQLAVSGCALRGMYPTMPNIGEAYVAHDVVLIGDKLDTDAIVAFFKQTEEAVGRRDVDAIMALYADTYRHYGFDTITLRRDWKRLIEQYSALSLTHVISEIRIDASQTPRTAHVKCSGSLWGIPTGSAKWTNVDSWFDEVSYFVDGNGGWRSRGHNWEGFMDKDRRFVRAPHPFS